eukprot:4403990-Ditylum_brightwellii.AAC.1
MELLLHDMMELEVPEGYLGTTHHADLDLHANTGVGGANVAMIDGTGERVYESRDIRLRITPISLIEDPPT